MIITDLIYDEGLYWIILMDGKFLICKGEHLLMTVKSFEEAKQIIGRLADEQS